jgi:hypothetical protein
LYFFQGKNYWRYDLKKDYGEVNYPKPMSEWRLPSDFELGIDGCLPGAAKFAGRAYFFRGGRYVSYDWKTGQVSEIKPLTDWCRGRSFPFPSGIDAALSGAGSYVGKAYFFKGAKYARYDWRSDEFDLLDQDISRWGLGAQFASGLSACVSLVEGRLKPTPIAYFFKGSEYVKYDWAADRAVDGYPISISAGWPTGCAVWAGHGQAPTAVCDDPRLDGGKNRVATYPYGSIGGQAGWQVSLTFRTIKELANKLVALKIPEWYGDDQADAGFVLPGRITRLGINAHGMSGNFAANGPNAMSEWITQGINDMRLIQDRELRDNFKRIVGMLAPEAPVLLLGCEVAQSLTGSNFIMTLSELLEGHTVTGLTTVGYAGGPGSKRGDLSEAGMRDTNFLKTSRSAREQDARVAKYWHDLDAWPWAWQYSPRAKTALNGQIIKRSEMDF